MELSVLIVLFVGFYELSWRTFCRVSNNFCINRYPVSDNFENKLILKALNKLRLLVVNSCADGTAARE